MDELKNTFRSIGQVSQTGKRYPLRNILSSAGKNEAEVKARASELVGQLRAGGDFAKIAAANSERESNGVRIAPQNGGKVGSFEMPNLREDIAKSIRNVQVGGVSEPLRTNDGYQIFRVDERIAGSTTATFNENQVREAVTIERGKAAREEYLQRMRNEAYIKLADSYFDAVAPLLNLKRETAAQNSGSSSEKPEKKKGKLLGIFPNRKRQGQAAGSRRQEKEAGQTNLLRGLFPCLLLFFLRVDLF